MKIAFRCVFVHLMMWRRGEGRRVTILTESEGVRNRGNLFRSEVSLLHILFFGWWGEGGEREAVLY